jgi:hypothetical protein
LREGYRCCCKPAKSKARGTKAMNACLSALYSEGVWIPSSQADRIATLGLNFLKCYGEVAVICYKRGIKRFQLIPKLHMLHHQFINLSWHASIAQWSLNPLCESVQMDEDFIGKPSRLSRRGGARIQAIRLLQRYLCSVRKHLLG